MHTKVKQGETFVYEPKGSIFTCWALLKVFCLLLAQQSLTDLLPSAPEPLRSAAAGYSFPPFL